MKFFIASPWRNTDAVKELTVALSDRGHTAYSFLDNGANRLSGAPALEESEEESPNAITDWENNPVVKEIFEFDMKVLKESDAVILLEPSGRSSLTEAGIAYGMGKKIILVGLVEHPEVVVYCICEKRYPSIEAFLGDPDGLAA
jgi:hypothetical protein